MHFVTNGHFVSVNMFKGRTLSVVRAIPTKFRNPDRVGEVGAILIIVFQILEITEISIGKKTNYCLKFSLVFSVI